jgi:uncharacterized membrane protein YkoI
MKRLTLIIAAFASLAVTPAAAAPNFGVERYISAPAQVEGSSYVRLAQAQKQISPSDAKRIALSRVRGGEVVDIRRTGDAYRVRVIARDGRVIDIVVDARTGRVR